jgi:hypothetical protein
VSGKPKWTREQQDQLLEELIEWLEAGKTLRDFCREPGKPSNPLIYRWIDVRDGMDLRIVRARERGCDAIAEDSLAIADDSSGDMIVDDDGEVRFDSENVARSKLRVDTRMRLIAKWNSGRYGDKLQVEAVKPTQILVDTGVPLSNEQLRALSNGTTSGSDT